MKNAKKILDKFCFSKSKFNFTSLLSVTESNFRISLFKNNNSIINPFYSCFNSKRLIVNKMNKRFSTSKTNEKIINPYTVVVDELMKNLRGDLNSIHFNERNFKHVLFQMEKCDYAPLEDELEEIIVKTASSKEVEFFKSMSLSDLITVFSLFKYLPFRVLGKSNQAKEYLEKTLLEKFKEENFLDKVSESI
jgi:hypothetical protein